jgi:GPH family glycoside/pentoside/hexuronide:cation symporter
LLLTFFGTKEQTEHQDLDRPSLKESLKAASRNRPFVFSAVIYLFTWVSVTILETTLLFFIKYVVERENQSDLLMASIFIAAIIALPFWSWASKNWNKQKAYIAGIAFWAVVQMVLITLTPATGMPLLLTLCILAGIGVGAAHVLPWSIIPDAVEWDEYQTGQRHEGIFYSLIMLMQKIASSIAIPLVLLLLEFTGYVPNAAQQSSQAVTGIKIVVGPVPAVLLSAAIVFAFLYPLSRERHAEIVEKLEDRRKSGASEVL